MEAVENDLLAAREAYSRGDWSAARHLFQESLTIADLTTDDLAALSDASWWLGIIDDSLRISEQVHDRLLDAGQARAAAMTAIEIGFNQMLRGNEAIGSGWLSRARRLLGEHTGSVEHGYLLMIDVTSALHVRDVAAAAELADQMMDVAVRHSDTTLRTIALFMSGSTMVQRGDVGDGLATLDEAMLTVVAGELDPSWAGNLYCQMMSLCHELGEIDRARQWTAATSAWCDTFETAVMFGGICRLHRVQLMQTGGEWTEAETEARRACVELADMNVGIVAEAHYVLGELLLCRDDRAAAEEAFGRAQELGRPPYPGLALLRLRAGKLDEAVAALKVALAEAGHDRLARAPVLAAAVEAALTAGELAQAETMLDELEDTAACFRSPRWTATAQLWRGALLNHRGDHAAGMPVLRDALQAWQGLGVPCEAARTRVEIARAADALGDHERAQRERDLAAATFAELDAPHWLADVTGQEPAVPHERLTARELEVLRAVAQGMTNREAADALFISHRTVDRHLTNVYAKLRLSSRAAAVAWAAQHRLLPRGG